ncbi:hypothetical protein U1Q18_048610 [Sarracenia purpurea var. burkii]
MEKLIRERGAIKAQLIHNTKLSDSFLSNEAALNELSETLDNLEDEFERVQDQIEVFLGPPDEGADDPQEIERENVEMTLLVLRAKIIQKRSEINHTPLKQGKSFVSAINSLIISQLRDVQYEDPSPTQPDSTSKLSPLTTSNVDRPVSDSVNVVPSTHTVNEVCFSSTKDYKQLIINEESATLTIPQASSRENFTRDLSTIAASSPAATQSITQLASQPPDDFSSHPNVDINESSACIQIEKLDTASTNINDISHESSLTPKADFNEALFNFELSKNSTIICNNSRLSSQPISIETIFQSMTHLNDFSLNHHLHRTQSTSHSNNPNQQSAYQSTQSLQAVTRPPYTSKSAQLRAINIPKNHERSSMNYAPATRISTSTSIQLQRSIKPQLINDSIQIQRLSVTLLTSSPIAPIQTNSLAV